MKYRCEVAVVGCGHGCLTAASVVPFVILSVVVKSGRPSLPSIHPSSLLLLTAPSVNNLGVIVRTESQGGNSIGLEFVDVDEDHVRVKEPLCNQEGCVVGEKVLNPIRPESELFKFSGMLS